MGQTGSSIELSNRVKISYFEKGSPKGIPLILLHGIADSWHVFELLMPYLPESLHSYAITLRGHGDSSRPDSGYKTTDFEEDLVLFMNALNIEKAVIIGASSGGFTARSFAINHPDRILALVLLGTPATLQGIDDAKEIWDSTISKMKDSVDLEFVTSFTRSVFYKPVSEEFMDMILQENLKLPARVWRETTEGMMNEEFPGKLGKISVPTLLIWGEEDRTLSRKSQNQLLKEIPGSQLVVRKKIGHMLYCEDPEGIAADIAAFINEISNN